MRRVVAAVLCLSAGVACSREPPAAATVEEQVIPVAAQPAEAGRVRPVLHVGGTIVPAPGAEFLAFAPEPARIIEITRKEGEPVAAGDLLVRLDIPSASTDLARQRADATRARAELENARATQARLRDFAERGLIARRELEDAERTLADAQSALSRAETLQAAAETAAGRTVIRAPFAGVIVQRLRNPGDVVSGAVTDPILRLVDPTRLEVRATVPAKELSRVLPGATARLAGSGGAPPAALVVAERSAPGVATNDAMGQVRLTFTGPATFDVETPVQVDIDLEERLDAVLVAPEAIVRDASGAAVFVAAGDHAERRAVTLGVSDDRRVQITSGVRAGELVIMRGHSGLADGAAISVDRGTR
jgi:RND family efflux transporter MFP subunit